MGSEGDEVSGEVYVFCGLLGREDRWCRWLACY